LCTLVVRRKKRKKKHNQLITNGNPTIICLHAPHHVEEGTTAYSVRQQMARFGHQKRHKRLLNGASATLLLGKKKKAKETSLEKIKN
jgi:hypothetical protein